MILKAHCKGCLGGSQNLDLKCWFDYKALSKGREIAHNRGNILGCTWLDCACCALRIGARPGGNVFRVLRGTCISNEKSCI